MGGEGVSDIEEVARLAAQAWEGAKEAAHIEGEDCSVCDGLRDAVRTAMDELVRVISEAESEQEAKA